MFVATGVAIFRFLSGKSEILGAILEVLLSSFGRKLGGNLEEKTKNKKQTIKVPQKNKKPARVLHHTSRSLVVLKMLSDEYAVLRTSTGGLLASYLSS